MADCSRACCHLASDVEPRSDVHCVLGTTAEIRVFRGFILPKLYVPQQTHSQNTSLGCRLVPDKFPLLEIVPFELYPYHKHPLKSTHFSGFWDPLHRNSESFHRFTTSISKMVKSVQDEWSKVRTVLVTTKTNHVFHLG